MPRRTARLLLALLALLAPPVLTSCASPGQDTPPVCTFDDPRSTFGTCTFA